MNRNSFRVLVIDDSQIAVGMCLAVLTEAGFDARGTSSLDEFDAVLAGWAPDLVLTDVNMPGLTGVELCRLLKDRYETAHLPIVLFSTRSEPELAELAIACEADGYLSKMSGLERLPGELRAICEDNDL